MNTKKNIDRLFQERLKNLEVSPNKKVWTEIESKLKKKKRRAIPIWWFSSGIAAILIIALVFFPFDESNEDYKEKLPQEIITTTPKSNKKRNTTDTTETKIVKTIEQKTRILNKNSVTKNQQNKSFAHKVELETKEVNNVKKEKAKNDFIASNTITNNEFVEKKSIKKEKIVTQKRKNYNSLKSSKKLDFKKSIHKDLEKKKSEEKKWSVATVFGILSSNSYTNSSPLYESLSGSTEGKNSISYGVQVAYQINKKWAIQSGLNLQQMRFENNQLAIASSNTNASNITFNSNQSFAFVNTNSASFNTSSLSSNILSLDGNLTQNYSYYEVPLEIKYNIISNDKFKTAIVSGFSTLFLNKNEVILTSQSFTYKGEASNLNSINFSGNIGFDLNYNLNSNLQLHFNPMIKTQLSTFNKNANGFKPFSVGIYTGVRFQF